MPNTRELAERQQRLVYEARSTLTEMERTTDMSRHDELSRRHDRIMAEFDQVEADINDTARAELRTGRRTGSDYRTAFYHLICEGGEIGGVSDEDRAQLKAGVKKWEGRTQTVGTSTAGGYTVPTELEAQIVKSMKAWGPMYDEDICSVLNTSAGNPIKLPTVDDTSVTAGSHTEGTALTDDGSKDVTFGQKSLDSYGFNSSFVRFSLELVRDSVLNMESMMANLLGERLGRIANLQLTTGSGSGAPDGIVTAAGNGKTAAAVNAIVYDEIIDLVHSVDPAYRQSPKVRFMFNDLVLASLRKLKDGDGRYIWTAGDIQGGVPSTIAGYRYSINQAMAGLSTGNKTMLFGDFGKYFVRKIGAPTIGVLRERFWPDLGIAGLIYLDGELADTAAVKYLVQA